MTQKFGFLLAAPIFSAALLGPLSAQVPTLALGKALASPDVEFTKITSLVELTGGRVLVADQDDNKLSLFDAATLKTQAVSRKGAGPGEYRALETLVLQPNGDAYLVDFALRRLLPITSSGGVGTTVPYPGGMWRQSDAQGRLYGLAFHPGGGGGRPIPDSSYILRWDPKTPKIDTLMSYDAGNSKHMTSSGEKRKMLPALDSWLVKPNGDVVIVEGATYRVRTYHDGKQVNSATVPWTKTPVTSAEQEKFMRASEAVKPKMMGGGGPPGVDRSTLPSQFIRGGYDFPATYPVFDNLMGDAAYLSPAGHIWVARALTPDETKPRYDIVGADGVLRARIVFPADTRLIGFGNGVLYAIEKNSDGAELVRKYAYPVK